MNAKKLNILLVVALLVGVFGFASAVRAGAEGSIEILSIDHTTLTITVDQEILCDPITCVGRIFWGDGTYSNVLPDDNEDDRSHVYAEPGCYNITFVVHNYVTLEEVTYDAGSIPVGEGASCEPVVPEADLALLGPAGEPFSAEFQVDWAGGYPEVYFGADSAGWVSIAISGTETISYTYGVVGVYEVNLIVGVEPDQATDSLCVEVTEAGAVEVSCDQPPSNGTNLFLPIILDMAGGSEEPPLVDCEGDTIQNPWFEQNCGWDFTGQVTPPWYATEYAYEGWRSLGLGVQWGSQDSLPAFSEAGQAWTVPAWASQLRVWVYAQSSEEAAVFGLLMAPAEATDAWATSVPSEMLVTASPTTDTSYVYLLRQDGSVIRRLFWAPDFETAGWTRLQWDISDLRGQTVVLLFGQYSDGDGNATRVYFDQVAVN